LPPDEVWITPWITVTNWSWMEKGFVSLKKTRDLVEDLEAVLAPGPGLVAAPGGPAAGPGLAVAPGLAAGPGLRTAGRIGPSLVTVPSLEVAPNLPPETPRRMGTKIGPGRAARARASLVRGQRTGPSLATAPGPGLLTDLVHAPTRNQNQSLVQDLVLNPGIKQQHYKTREKTRNNN
jgi:hypothetical protein